MSVYKAIGPTLVNLYTLISGVAEQARQARRGHGFHTGPGPSDNSAEEMKTFQSLILVVWVKNLFV